MQHGDLKIVIMTHTEARNTFP